MRSSGPTKMPHRTYRCTFISLLLFAISLILAMPCHAESGGDFAALQASAKKAFREQAEPFVTSYCKSCHGEKKMKGGFTFNPALKTPGDANSNRIWKQALATVKTHDMPPDDADMQPTDEERRRFMDWVGSVKYLSPKDPGPFVMRRLTKVE